jgi:cytochrome b pre-mRNA-processing protein 3
MIFNLFRRKKSNCAIVTAQYEELTSAARQVVLYQSYNAPDTVLGRFDMMTIHMVLYLRATRGAGENIPELSQDVVDSFFEDIDHSIRELGIGDAGVPKRMKKLAKMFYGRAEAYGAAIDANNIEELTTALARNIHPELVKDEDEQVPDMTDLAQYMIDTDQKLKAFDHTQLIKGQLVFLRV